MALSSWAVPQLQKILPLDEQSLKDIIDYTSSLSREGAADHLKNLLGDSPQSFEFIASFNARRQAPTEIQPPVGAGLSTAADRAEVSEVPRPKKKEKKGPKFNKLPPPRRPADYGDVTGGYVKRQEEDYMSGSSSARPKEAKLANTLALKDTPDALQLPLPDARSSTASSSRNHSPKPPPSAAGTLISDLPNVKSRTASPAPSKAQAKTKVSITGGVPMHGASIVTTDLDYAIRALELQTNPSLAPSAADNAKRRCNCMATRHPLLDAAPNCLNCGKIICVKEGLGPCTFCDKPLLSGIDMQAMIQVLREERGKERMNANNAANRRAEVSTTPRPFANLAKPGSLLSTGFDATPASASRASSANASDSEDAAQAKLRSAKEHRDRLLDFQAQNARRTTIRDEAADFETPTSGLSMWSSPQERALQLKRQQKVLREQEWNARPEWEKRRVVASIDVVGGKVVKRMEKVARPESPDGGDVGDGEDESAGAPKRNGNTEKGGAFSRNPLLGALIRPVARERGGGGKRERVKDVSSWRRVQDDETDNEHWILDGGAYGPSKLPGDEPTCLVDPSQVYK